MTFLIKKTGMADLSLPSQLNINTCAVSSFQQFFHAIQHCFPVFLRVGLFLF